MLQLKDMWKQFDLAPHYKSRKADTLLLRMEDPMLGSTPQPLRYATKRGEIA
jgi:hypothetical protein